MEATDDDDVKLVKASASLLADLQTALPKLLWKRAKDDTDRLRRHTCVKRRDLDYIVKLLEPFQAEPQLLDASLRHILPPIVDAYRQDIHQKPPRISGDNVGLESAVCILLYTLCKVRGYKIILQFFNNEPRHLEPILSRLEAILENRGDTAADWHVPYILLLWLSHLLLTPFDLKSLSGPVGSDDILEGRVRLPHRLPSIAERALFIGLRCLSVPTKAQDAAATLLVRFVTRPDMRKLSVAEAVVTRMLQILEEGSSDTSLTVYEQLGPLRFLAGVCSASELADLMPDIFRTCERLADGDESSPIMGNAVAKKLMIKIFRNMTILSLRRLPANHPLQSVGPSGLLEDVIDYSLRSLGDRDTPVRYAAAKALSMIVPQLEPGMGHEVIQAVLDSFQDDVPVTSGVLDFRDANALKWHGLTLALAHTLFKRSASPDQLSDIVRVLVSALQFEQRTATGSSVGTNVRDAANFGIWSFSRRYTTSELLSVNVSDLPGAGTLTQPQSVIQYIATQLILSACLDPAGNIRRGSSAALQELIGRHPNEVYEGIALVQVVDYQAVGLRKRAMLDVVQQAAQLHKVYWNSSVSSVFEWRGLGSSDVASREAAAASLARLSTAAFDEGDTVLLRVLHMLHRTAANDSEELHGLVLALAYLLEEARKMPSDREMSEPRNQKRQTFDTMSADSILDILTDATKDFSLRMLRAELPCAIVQLLAALCGYHNPVSRTADSQNHGPGKTENLTERLLSRHEDTILRAIPSLVQELIGVNHSMGPFGCLDPQYLTARVEIASTKNTLHGAGNAIALGALAPCYQTGLVDEKAITAITTLAELTAASNVDWRIIGVKALQLAVKRHPQDSGADVKVFELIGKAMHRAMNDYTIDERGDVGSLVRLQSIACASELLNGHPDFPEKLRQVLHADILRLSLEKLDRVRLAAAQCRFNHFGFELQPTDFASVSSQAYFAAGLRPLARNEPAWKHRALLEGAISCAGISAEPLLQASRAALGDILCELATPQVQEILSIFAAILKAMLTEETNSMHAALELLAYLLDMRIPQRLVGAIEGSAEGFKWRNLLSTVQKSHHKSNDIPKILTAVQVYIGLADIPSIRPEVMKKLFSMLKTNPYPRVCLKVAETLFVLTHEPDLKERDWLKPASQNREFVQAVEQRYVT